MPFNLPFKGY
ncbi:uncharacterized protein FFM5_06101 [Fusarium fujikuroi]|nr:uncharacterized protein FFM5_06101 [Fusarium fujikuroi]